MTNRSHKQNYSQRRLREILKSPLVGVFYGNHFPQTLQQLNFRRILLPKGGKQFLSIPPLNGTYGPWTYIYYHDQGQIQHLNALVQENCLAWIWNQQWYSLKPIPLVETSQQQYVANLLLPCYRWVYLLSQSKK